MKCSSFTTSTGVHAIVCGPKKRAPKCSVCGAGDAPRLCDGKIESGKTCDAPLCSSCAYRPRKQSKIDYCPKHTKRPTTEEDMEAALLGSIELANPLLKAPGADGLVNELTWSKSRRGKFDECRRAYFNAYYGAWGGWDARADPKAKRLYMLKHLTTRAMWVGNSVHDAVKLAMEKELAGDFVRIEGALEQMVAAMKKQLAQSKRATYRQIKKGFGLVEHELGFPDGAKPKDSYFDKAFAMAESGLLAIYTSQTYARATIAALVKTVDALDGFQLEGTKIYVAPDVAFERPEESDLEVVDWKTGKPKESDSEQIVIYVAYASAKWSVPIDRIVGRLVYANVAVEHAAAEEPEFRIDRSDVELFRSDTLRSIAAMRALHGQPEEAFPKTKDAFVCEWCVFRGECWPKGRVS